MYATHVTADGLVVPVGVNPFEYRRRYLAWKEEQAKQFAWDRLHDESTRRALYLLRNEGVEGLLRMDSNARAERKAKEEEGFARIRKMMIDEAVFKLKHELGLSMRSERPV